MENSIKQLKKLAWLGIALVSTLATAVATSMDNSSQSTVQNQTAKFNLAGKLNDMYPDNNIEVTVFNNEILLTGQVASQALKDSVYREAQHSAIAPVVYNQLSIGKKQSATQTSRDAFISSKVSAKILTISGVASGKVKVVTCNAVVYLLGTVNKSQNIAIINNISKIKGIKRIVDLMAIID